jgi:solute:Na+ symporter, SSS family
MFNSLVLYLAIYIGFLFLLSWLASRKQQEEDFLIAGRNRGGWQILLSKFAASIGAGYFITYTGFAYEYGIGVFAMLAGLIAGFLVFAYWAAPKIAAGSREGKFYTIGHFVYSKFQNNKARLLADVFSSGILFSWLLVGIIGSGKIIADFGLLSYNSAVIVTSLVILGYLLIAGFRAVLLTDVVQSIVIFILMAVVTFGVIGTSSFAELHSFSTGSFDIGTAIGFFLFGILSVFSYSDRYQLSYAARSEKGLRHGLGLSTIPILLVAYFLLLIGVFMATNVPGLDSGLVFTEALKQFLNPSLIPLAIVLFFAGIMSSADTNIYAISSHYALSKKNDNNYTKNVRKAMIGLTIIVTILAIAFPNIVKVSIVAGAVSLLLSWAMIYTLAGGKNQNRFIGSVVTSTIGLALAIAYFGLEPTAAIAIVVFGPLGLLYKGRKTELQNISTAL